MEREQVEPERGLRGLALQATSEVEERQHDVTTCLSTRSSESGLKLKLARSRLPLSVFKCQPRLLHNSSAVWHITDLGVQCATRHTQCVSPCQCCAHCTPLRQREGENQAATAVSTVSGSMHPIRRNLVKKGLGFFFLLRSDWKRHFFNGSQFVLFPRLKCFVFSLFVEAQTTKNLLANWVLRANWGVPEKRKVLSAMEAFNRCLTRNPSPL